MLKNFMMIILTVLLNTAGQFLMKTGVNRIGAISLFDNFLGTFFRAVTNWFVIGGFGLYVISAAFWIVILSRAELSWAFPMVSLGTIIICAGVFLVSRT